MKLSHFFIDHPRFAAVVNIFIMVFGLAAAAFLPVAQYPNIVPPTVQITTAYPGASAETIARTVATPLEQAINGVENMDYISSQSTSNGLLTITVIFKIGTDINTALMLTHNRVQDTLSRLPQEVQLQSVQVKKTIPALLLGVLSLFTGWISQCQVHLQLHDSSCQRRDRATSWRGRFLDTR
jgi:multidrug efflux pump subunit AcrB